MCPHVNDLAPVAPSDDQTASDYHRDFYSWLLEQAGHLRARRWDALDRDNLIEEIESLGREQFNKLESALPILMAHMLKWDHQPRKRSRSWLLSIKEQRFEIEDVLSDNPGLRPRIPEAIGRAYRKARLQAMKETGLPEEQFPISCPYSYQELTERAFPL